MFYFQYVIQKVRIDYNEFNPEITVRFGEITSKLELTDLTTGDNLLGLGKELTIDVSAEELAMWFREYAFCMEFRGGLTSQRPLSAVCSLEKLDLTDEINGFQIVLRDKFNAKARVQLQVSLKFRHMHLIPASLSKTQLVQQREKAQEQSKYPGTVTSNDKKSTFLYGNNVKSIVKTQNIDHRNPPKKRQGSKSAKQDRHQLGGTQPMVYNQYQPYPGYLDNLSLPLVPAQDMFGQQYFCPPAIEFTNTPQRSPQIVEPVLQSPASVSRKQEVHNYSFQKDVAVSLQSKEKIIQKSKIQVAIDKKKIKQLVEQEFKGSSTNVMVPVCAPNGDIMFKKLSAVQEKDLQNLVSQKAQSKAVPQVRIESHLAKRASSYVPPSRDIQSSPVNISMEYPQDFQSMSLGNHSVIHKQFSTISKILRADDVVHQESMASEIYSENFENYSLSRSNIRKSFDDISESIRSLSQSHKK